MTCKQFFLSCNRSLPCNATRYIDGILAVKLKAVHVHYITVFTIGVILHVLLFVHKEMTKFAKNITQNMNYVNIILLTKLLTCSVLLRR